MTIDSAAPGTSEDSQTDTGGSQTHQPHPESEATPDKGVEASSERPFQPRTYPSWLGGETPSRAKLHDSGVAPLVAAARGYERLTDTDQVKRWVDKHALASLGLTNGRRKNAKIIRGALETGGVTAIPMFDSGDLFAESSRASTWQFRPDAAVAGADGAARKYLFLAESRTVLDVHPATPRSWMSDAGSVVLTEGTIKVDAGITGMLLDAGVSVAELSSTGDTIESSRAMLTELLETINPADATLVVGLAGVAAWHSHVGWNAIPLKDRDVYIAFDGDVLSNPNVWREASRMFDFVTQRRGRPHRFDLSDPSAVDGSGHLGLDDYLVTVGDWASLAARTHDTLPDNPIEARPGEWRVNTAKHVTEEFKILDQETGRGAWSEVVPFAGRILSDHTARKATDAEVRTGQPATTGDAEADSRVIVEVSWFDDAVDAEPRVALVSGPARMLMDSPDRWHRSPHVTIPSDLARRSGWPRGRDAERWLDAVKANRPNETEVVASWGHMGWVPTNRGICAFIAGETVIGPDGIDDDHTLAVPGVTEVNYPGASRLGVNMPDDIDQARADLRRVIDTFRHAWMDSRVAAAVMAAGLRPIVPAREIAVASLFSGPPRSAKSWSAAAAMQFWASDAGGFNENLLPGSANDTPFKMETDVARTMIHTIDDLAPSVDRNKASRAEDTIAQLVRDAHNRTARGRMNPDGTPRERLLPRAALIVTAENSLSVTSALDRVVHVPLTASGLNDDGGKDDMDQMRDRTVVASRVTGALIAWIARRGVADGWLETVQLFESQFDSLKAECIAQTNMGGASSRHVNMAANMALGLQVASLYALEHLGDADLAVDLDRMIVDLFSLLDEHRRSQASRTPGHALLAALREVMVAGRGHVTSTIDDDPKPLVELDSGDYPPRLARQLGWDIGGAGVDRPGGETIGVVLTQRSTGMPHVLFNRETAFNLAKREHPELISHGSGSHTSWQSMWTDGLTTRPEDGWARRTRGGVEGVTCQATVEGHRYEGIPVPLEMILNGPEETSDDD